MKTSALQDFMPAYPVSLGYHIDAIYIQPRDVSRVSEPETAEEVAFKRLPTFKIKAKKAFGIGRFRSGQIQALQKYLGTFH